MPRFFAFLVILMIPAMSAYPQKGWRDHESEVRVKISNPGEAKMLHDLRLNGDIHLLAGNAVLYVIPSELEQLKETGLQAEVLVEDLNASYEGFWSGRAEQYHSYEQTIALMDSLATAFPALCKKIVFGLTPQGRQLTCLKISDNVNQDENEPEILFDGGIHGDEIGGPENLIRFARHLCTRYESSPEITDLVNSREITIYPMVNPDGRANMSRYNSNFVDCNRDWGYMWDGEGNSPGAFSQPETRAIRDCLNSHRFVIHVTYHSGEEVVLYPWCYRAAHVPDYAALSHLADDYSSSSGYPNLQVRQSYADYPTNGETIDYSYGAGGAGALTMEISNNKQPPGSQIQYYFQNNLPAMIAMTENAGSGIEGTVTNSNTGEPVRAVIFISNFFPCYSDPDIGDFHKYLLPGTYSMKVIASNYVTKVINNVVVTGQSPTVINVELQPGTGQYATKVGAVVIPGNNFADEANTPAVIGSPDSISYSLGKNGWIIVDMEDTVVNIPGDDFTVYQGNSEPESFSCLVGQTIDGPWISLGSGTGTTAFDLAPTGWSSIRFIKILDDGVGQPNVPDAGFDLDAIETIPEPTGVHFTEAGTGSLTLSPNPASGIVTVSTSDKTLNGLITIYNVRGQTVMTHQLTDGLLRFNSGMLSGGVYYVTFKHQSIPEGRILIIK